MLATQTAYAKERIARRRRKKKVFFYKMYIQETFKNRKIKKKIFSLRGSSIIFNFNVSYNVELSSKIILNLWTLFKYISFKYIIINCLSDKLSQHYTYHSNWRYEREIEMPFMSHWMWREKMHESIADCSLKTMKIQVINNPQVVLQIKCQGNS